MVLGAGLVGALAACFDGVGTLGAICFADNQCGLDQRCVNSVCGQCNNRAVDAGELCFGDSSEENVFGEVSDLLAYDPEGDGRNALLLTTINTNCLPPPNTGPPTMDNACWRVRAMIIDDATGDFEVTNPLDDDNLDGIVPQAATGDFDGQSTRDVALAIFPTDPNIDMSQLTVVHNLALSGSQPIQLEIDISLRARTLHAADMNGDGLDDILVGGEESNTLALLPSTPGVGFGAERQFVINEAGPRPAPPVDMDNDGDLDVVLVAEADRRVAVYRNDGSGNLSPQASHDIEAPLNPQDLATADFDRDGNQDVVVFIAAPSGAGDVESELRVYRGLGDGSLELDQTLPGGDFPVSGLAADFNFDGWPDIMVADIMEDKLPVHINRGGSFPDSVTIDVAAAPRTLMYEDADFDSIPDLVIGNANGVVAVVPSEN
jgi:hypothetical protein